MRKKWICLVMALALCALWTAATADGGYVNSAGRPIDLIQFAARPYTWEVQEHRGSPIATYVENALDGNRYTEMWFGCWNAVALDEIPDISFYFDNATVKDIWIRNGSEKPNYRDYARMGNLAVVVWTGDTCSDMYFPRRPIYNQFYNLQDNYDSEEVSDDFYDGYQRFGLPMQYEHVTRIDFFVKGWYEGEIKDNEHRYQMWISDIAFLPDALSTLVYGGGSGYPPQDWPYYGPTATPAPTATPVPRETATPEPGLQVLTAEQTETRSGPGANYTDLASGLPAGTWVKALSASFEEEAEVWWIQTEITYGGEKRRAYTPVKQLRMQETQVQLEEAIGNAVLTRSVFGYWGPGFGYTMYNDKIPYGTSGTVWQEEGAYAQFEYFDENLQQSRRVWVPVGALQFGNG